MLSYIEDEVKKSLELNFPYPDFITAVHMFAVLLVALCLERPKRKEP